MQVKWETPKENNTVFLNFSTKNKKNIWKRFSNLYMNLEYPEAYLEASQTSMMELLCKIS